MSFHFMGYLSKQLLSDSLEMELVLSIDWDLLWIE